MNQENSQKDSKKDSQKDILFINSGSYGCVFNSEIPCSSNKGHNKHDEKKYVSKLTVISDKHNDDNEKMIGKLVKNIQHYEYYFAPILSTCPINIGVIDDEEIEKCDVIAKSKTKSEKTNIPSIYVTNKMRFVGDDTITQYLETNINNQETKKIFETHLHLMKALDKLNSLPESIIHYDLKSDNIMFDTIQNVPIIIDFGLSFTHTKMFDALLKPENLRSIFYNDQSYSPWSIEIQLLSFITINIVSNDEDIDNIFVQKYLDDFYRVLIYFINAKSNLTVFDSKDDKNQFERKIIDYITSFKHKTIKEFIHDLMSSWKSWDNYSIAVMYKTYIFKKDELLTDPYIVKYKDLIKTIILALPSERINSLETYHSILKLCRE